MKNVPMLCGSLSPGQVVDGGDSLQIWRGAMNILGTNKVRSSNLGCWARS